MFGHILIITATSTPIMSSHIEFSLVKYIDMLRTLFVGSVATRREQGQRRTENT